MKYYMVLNYMGDVKVLTPNEKLADDIAEDDDIICIHDTGNMKIIFDENKVILENKRLIKQIDVEFDAERFNEATKEILERKRW